MQLPTTCRTGGTRLLFSGVLVLALGSGSCGGEQGFPESALLVTIDTLRADAVGAYGGQAGLTPHMDRLAEEGIVFERAYATVPLTLPSHASMMTGLTPLRSSVRDNGYEVLPDAAVTLAERARAAGAQTAAFVSATVLHPDFGLDQGFELYESPSDSEVRSTTEYPSLRAAEVVTLALQWLEQRDKSKPFLLWVHLWDVHKPWEPEAKFRSRAPGNPYLQEVASADDALGRLMQGLRNEGSLDTTTVLVVSDHGESLGEHGEDEHGVFCYDSTMHIPLLLRPSAAKAGSMRGSRVQTIASVVDVAPTLAAALDLNSLGEIDGFNLFEDLPDGRGAYIESYYAYRSYGWSPITGWVDGDAKYLHGKQPELYDIAQDASETRNIISQHGELAEGHRRAIADQAAKQALTPSIASISDQRREQLQALGYAAGGDDGIELPHPLEISDRPSPRRRTSSLVTMSAAYQLLAAGKYAAAEMAYDKILSVDPDNLWCQELFATSLLAQGKPREAVTPLQRVVAGGRGTAITFGNLGHALTGAERYEEAMFAFCEALDLNPERIGALRALVRLTTQGGRPEVARPYVERYEERTGTSFTP